MGNSKSEDLSNFLLPYHPEAWLKVDDQGLFEVWQQRQSGKRFQVYPAEDSLSNNQEQLEKYSFRKINGRNLVTAEALLAPGESFLCSRSNSSFLLIENITHRLGSFSQNQFTFSESLTILSSACAGYNILNSFYGPLEPTSDMVCFNEDGLPKIWLNENLSKN